MSVAARIAALVEALRLEGFDDMRPADRRHLRDLCRFIANRADPDQDGSKTTEQIVREAAQATNEGGVLADARAVCSPTTRRRQDDPWRAWGDA